MGFVDLLDSWRPLGSRVTSEKSSKRGVGGFSNGKEHTHKKWNQTPKNTDNPTKEDNNDEKPGRVGIL